MISYTEDVLKKLNVIPIFCHTNRTSSKISYSKKKTSRFVGKVMFTLEFDSKFFLLSTNNMSNFIVKFGNFLYFFAIFY
jgi:hypothetical protein